METPPAFPDDVLAQPTRARLFELLRELMREASSEELAERLGMHVNGVRRHLERLAAAGLVARSRRPQRRGRPRDLWSVAAGGTPGGEAPSSYADLSAWLAAMIAPGSGRLREIESSGRRIGRELAPAGSDGSARAFEQALSALGFQPRLEAARPGAVCCRLDNCPYKEAARTNQQVVCTLHKGITAGLLEVLAPQARLSGFEPQDPDRAGCLIEVTGSGWQLDAAD